jgi:hypothetical protein
MVADNQPSNVIAFAGNTMVYESTKRFSVKGINNLIRVLMENVDDALFDLSEKVENDRERNMYFEAMREIRLKRKTIQENFDEEIRRSFDRLITNSPQSSREISADELSLVDMADMEDSLAIDNMISKARPHFEDELFAIVERLKIILHRKQIKDDLNPLDPGAICKSFHNASDILDTDIQVKLIFYKLFDKFVMSNLGAFYRELNEFFIRKGVLPEFKASQERLRKTTQFMTDRMSRRTGIESTPNNSRAASEDGNLTNAEPTTTHESNVLSMLQNLLMPQGQASAGTIPFAGVTGDSMFMGNPQSASSAQSQGGGAMIPDSAFMGALSNLQTAKLMHQPVYSIDPASMKSELQQQLVTFKQQNNHPGSASENQIIDIVSMLFDFFFDDQTLPDPIKVLIGRLQIPILKVAILDASFFNHKKHPARKLLDSISKAALGWSENQQREKQLIDKIEKIVEFLLAEFEQDVAVFEQALQEFEQFVKDDNQLIEQNVQQIAHQEEDREKQISDANNLADRLLVKLESKSDFSFEVIDFLEGVWRKVLVNTLLAQGQTSRHWINLKKTSSTLIWTLIPKHSEDEKLKLLKTLPPLLRALSKGMELVQIDTEHRNEIFQMLVLEHARIVKQTSKNLVTRVDDNTVWPEDNMAQALAGFNQSEVSEDNIDFLLSEDETGEIQMINNSDLVDREGDSVVEIEQTETRDLIHNLQEFTDGIVKGDIYIDDEIIMESSAQSEFQQSSVIESDDFLEQAQALEIGTWVEFIESESSSLHAKLSWKSNLTGKCVFVNRQGHKIKNMTSYGFATELRAGRARLIESVSVFDRAINSFMSRMRH